MADAVTERRAWRRISTIDHAELGHGRLRPGRPAQILDVSRGGALIETEWRLLPGTRVELQLGEPTPVYRAAGRLLRCHVALLGGGRIRYRGALRFEELLPFDGNEATHG